MSGVGRADQQGALRTFSYGGGVQSTAALVLAAQGQIDFRTFLFANVGDDSERPATLVYVRDVAMPYAAAHGIGVYELHREWSRGDRAGMRETLLGRLTKDGSRSLPIPVRMSNGAPGNRTCTADFKIRVIARWLREHGATKANPATVGIGISTDEIERAKPGVDPRNPLQRRTYPLLDLGLDRAACAALIGRAGLPVPGKSSCWFCPLHRPSEWARMRRDEPAMFAASVELEALLNERRGVLGKDPVWFTRFNGPLADVIHEAQQALWDEGAGCESGYCMT